MRGASATSRIRSDIVSVDDIHKGDLATYGNALIPTVKYLFAPSARPSIFIKEHGSTSLVCATGRPAAAALETPLGAVKVL